MHLHAANTFRLKRKYGRTNRFASSRWLSPHQFKHNEISLPPKANVKPNGKSIVDAARFHDRVTIGPHAIMMKKCAHDSTLYVPHHAGNLELFLRYGETWRGDDTFNRRNSFISEITVESIRV